MTTKKVAFQIDALNEEASITVGDETYRLSFDLAAIRVFYLTWNVNPAVEPIGLDPSRWASLLWVGLLRYQPDFDPERVKSWFSGSTTAELMAGVRGAFLLALPEAKPDEAIATENPPGA